MATQVSGLGSNTLHVTDKLIVDYSCIQSRDRGSKHAALKSEIGAEEAWLVRVHEKYTQAFGPKQEEFSLTEWKVKPDNVADTVMGFCCGGLWYLLIPL
jgi:hypothetical protein